MRPNRVWILVVAGIASLTVSLLPAADAGARKNRRAHKERRAHKARILRTKTLGREVASLITLAPASGSVVSGTVAWQVSVSGATASRVEFSIDGANAGTDGSAPFAFPGDLDTAKMTNGQHILKATAYAKGKLGATSVGVAVENAAPASAPLPEPAPEPQPESSAPSSSIYWGAWIGDQLTGHQAPWDMTAVSKFEELAGKRLSMVHFSSPFANCATSPCTNYAFPSGAMELIRNHGSIPFFSWASQSTPSSVNEPSYQLSDVLAGTYDSYIRSFATAAKNWGHPFFLRFNWEMNGTWFPWSERVNGNQPGESVAVWRHVHDIFASVGATNATWVWCPNIDPDRRFQSLTSLYPGSAYVDWTCLDGYNWGTNPTKSDRWRTFDQLYGPTYREITETVAPSKPMVIGEMGSTEYGGSKGQWISEALSRIPAAYPKIRGLLWFEKFEGGMDWPIETSSGSTAGFASGIGNSAYATNAFGGLGATAISPAG